MYKEYTRQRIDELRMKKNIPESQLGLDLGKSSGYIQSISSGRTMPSMSAFFDICSYFDISPSEFFDPDIKNPSRFHEIMNIIKCMSESDQELLLTVLTRYKDIKSSSNNIQ